MVERSARENEDAESRSFSDRLEKLGEIARWLIEWIAARHSDSIDAAKGDAPACEQGGCREHPRWCRVHARSDTAPARERAALEPDHSACTGTKRKRSLLKASDAQWRALNGEPSVRLQLGSRRRRWLLGNRCCHVRANSRSHFRRHCCVCVNLWNVPRLPVWTKPIHRGVGSGALHRRAACCGATPDHDRSGLNIFAQHDKTDQTLGPMKGLSSAEPARGVVTPRQSQR